MKAFEMKTPVSVPLGEMLGELQKKKICFVCTGNTCRSPMAAAVLNELGKAAGYTATSAGLAVFSGQPVSENAISALKERGIEASQDNPFNRHISHMADENILKTADEIIGITEAHTMMLISSFPSQASKIRSMPHDISDPYGGDIDVYLKCLDEIIMCIREMYAL